MKKRCSIGLCAMILFNVVGQTIATTSGQYHNVFAEEITEELSKVEQAYIMAVRDGAVTDEQWNQIPEEDWVRYSETIGRTMVPDNMFYLAFEEHPDVFYYEINRIYDLMAEKYQVEYNDFMHYIVDRPSLFMLLLIAKRNEADLYTKVDAISKAEPLPDRVAFLSREQAIQRVIEFDEGVAMKINMARYSGLPKEVLAQISDEEYFQAAVAHAMRNPLGGDYGTQIAVFKRTYPKYFEQADETTRQTQQSKIEKIQSDQKKLQETLTQSVQKYEEVPKELQLEFLEGQFNLEQIYLLVPGEAGNQSEDYLLGIRFNYTNTTQDEVAAPETIVQLASNMMQFEEEELRILESSIYPIESQVVDETSEKIELDEVEFVLPNEEVTATIYYKVPNSYNDLVWSVVENDQVQSYRLDIEKLLKLPYQSASYYLNSDEQVGYIFDFDKLYLVYRSSSDLQQWENKENVEEKSDLTTLSDVATSHYQQISAQLADDNLKLVELSKVRYLLDDDEVHVFTGNESVSILKLITETKWDDFKDSNNLLYKLIAID